MKNPLLVKSPSGIPFEFDPEVTGEGLEVLDDAAQLERLRRAIQRGIDSGPAIAIDPMQFLQYLKDGRR